MNKKAFRAALRKAPAVIRKGIFGLMKVVATLRTKGYKENAKRNAAKLVPTSNSRATAPARSMVSKMNWNDKSWTSKPVSKNFQSSRLHFPSLQRKIPDLRISWTEGSSKIQISLSQPKAATSTARKPSARSVTRRKRPWQNLDFGQLSKKR